jgi:long-chain acyl-CoA synthetase
MPLLNVLKDFATTTPNTTFLLEGRERLTYEETFRLTRQMADGLSRKGVKPGDRVILALHNCLEFCISLYGIQWAGATAVLVNPRWTAFEIENAFSLTKPSLVIGDPANLMLKSNLWLTHAPEPIISSGNSNFERRLAPEDIAAMLLTSGTTGKPKAVMLTHRSIFANASQLAKRKLLSSKDRFLCSIPMFHSNGHTAALQSMLVAGSSLVLLDKFTPEGLLESAQKYECTAISGVPTLYQHLINHFADKPVDLSKLRICVSGGAPMPVSLFHEVEKRFGAFILEGYGLTETSAGACGNPLDNRKIGSVGLPLDNTEIKIVNDSEQVISAGETGEILIRGPQLMRGYFEDPASTQAALTADGWLRSGDLGSVDDDGFVTIRSRKKELIIRSGFNVYPAEVENVIRSIDGIQDVTVIGLPDPLYGEAVHAAVISDLDETELSVRLKKFSETMLARYKRPTSYSLHKDFPKTGSTKVQKTGVVAQLKDEPSLVKLL